MGQIMKEEIRITVTQDELEAIGNMIATYFSHMEKHRHEERKDDDIIELDFPKTDKKILILVKK